MKGISLLGNIPLANLWPARSLEPPRTWDETVASAPRTRVCRGPGAKLGPLEGGRMLLVLVQRLLDAFPHFPERELGF